MSLIFKCVNEIASIPKEAWDALCFPKASENPFVRHAWLDALEQSGCAGAERDFQPMHLTLSRGKDLVAAAPAYLKETSDGDFSRDWGMADAAQRAGIPYYPKLIVTVPFTPVTGRRILIAPGEPDLTEELLAGAEKLARKVGAHSVHVLFPTGDEVDRIAQHGLTKRVAFQYHWRNAGYKTSDEFLGCFDSKRRNQLKRERSEPLKQNITIRTVRGEEMLRDSAKWGKSAFELHRHTVDKLAWGRRWLNRGFYDHVFANMPESLEVVAAEQDGRLIAGAFNVATPTHLFGRYWGCFEEHRFLHFNVCLYHSIDECIANGTQVFEGGAGGEHKLARGFEPAETYSAHRFFDARLEIPFHQYLRQEAEERAQALERWRAERPILKRAPGLERAPGQVVE